MKKNSMKYIVSTFIMVVAIMITTLNSFANEGAFSLVKVLTDNNVITVEKGYGEVLGRVYKNEDIFLKHIDGDYGYVSNADGTIEGYISISAIGYEVTSDGLVSRGATRANADAVIELAKSKLGTPYSYGSIGPNRFDCSGFVKYVMGNAAGVSLPHSSAAMGNSGTAISRADLKKGDLILFNTNGNPRTINHVGIYIGDGEFIHCASGKTRKVIISNINSGYYNKAYHSARRVL